jgi:hypothetical protein
LSLTIFIVTPGNWKGGEYVRPIYSVNPSDLGYLPVASLLIHVLSTQNIPLSIFISVTPTRFKHFLLSLSFLERMEVVQVYALPSVRRYNCLALLSIFASLMYTHTYYHISLSGHTSAGAGTMEA